MFIIRTLIITVYIYYITLKKTLQPIWCLAYYTLEHNANNTYSMCITGVCTVCKSTPN